MKNVSILSGLISLAYLMTPVMGQIEAGQSIQIKILGVPVGEKGKIDEVYSVTEKGIVSMPFVGDVHAEGLTAGELAKSIERAYREGEIFSNPTIQVVSNGLEKEVNREVVHVGGKVKNSGPRPFMRKMTVFQAVQAAGGANEFGAMNRVILWRDGKQEVVDLTDAEGMGVLVEPDDTIQVPQKNWRGK
jgi:polysaccharide export outer membrane protein